MTKISIFKANGFITGFECAGHTGYAESGQDILCSAISTLVGACHLGLAKVLGLGVNFKIDENKGYFFLEILDKNAICDEKAQVVLKTFEQSVMELASKYKKFIKLIGG